MPMIMPFQRKIFTNVFRLIPSVRSVPTSRDFSITIMRSVPTMLTVATMIIRPKMMGIGFFCNWIQVNKFRYC